MSEARQTMKELQRKMMKIPNKTGTDLHRRVPYKKTLENDKYRLKLLLLISDCKITNQYLHIQAVKTLLTAKYSNFAII